jgi:hypothetical protein
MGGWRGFWMGGSVGGGKEPMKFLIAPYHSLGRLLIKSEQPLFKWPASQNIDVVHSLDVHFAARQ